MTFDFIPTTLISDVSEVFVTRGEGFNRGMEGWHKDGFRVLNWS